MIIWLHGTFGVGKSSVADELKRRLPGALIFDPELVGEMLAAILPTPTGDFQDLPHWRDMVIATAATLHAHHDGPIIVPMTLLREAYAREIITGMETRRIQVRQVLLDADADELRRRIDADGSPADGEVIRTRRRWRLEHLDRYAISRHWLVPSVELTVDTTHLDEPAVAAHIIERLRLPPCGRRDSPTSGR